ncbi:MAG: cytochrome-c oxidase, cbb3-type subunit III [Pseudomonadota bacterium]
MQVEFDEVSGRNTTGHEWDGIKELDTPVPWPTRWALWLTILFAIGYWLLYPAWPVFSDFTRGALGYSSRELVLEKVANAADSQADTLAVLVDGNLEELAGDPEVHAQFEHAAGVLYRDNCAMCHGRDLKGQKGFPNLTDGHWLWSGLPEEIEYTLQVGINSGHEDERAAEMLAFGAQGILEKADVRAVTHHVLAISGQEHDGELASTGATIFEENCAGCHGDDGEGGYEIGAPSLIDEAWIYGGSREAIYRTIWSGRRGVMPFWSGRLTDAEIRKLALYVHWNGQERSDD